MKVILIFFLLVFGHLSFAQTNDTTAVSSEAKQAFLVERLTEELILTEKQQTSVRQIIRERSSQISEAKLHQKGSSHRSESVTAANTKAKQQLRAVLTEDQFELFVELRKDLKKQQDAYYAHKQQENEVDDEELDF